jgi:hypothetical protein
MLDSVIHIFMNNVIDEGHKQDIKEYQQQKKDKNV